MIFKQVFDKKSSTYTYIIASAKGREALIIDPVLENVEDYIKILNQLNLKLVKVIDTHIHADHVTGAGKLRDKTKCVTIMGEHTGRTDFQNGSSTDAYNSIFNRLLKLPDDTLLYPAHDYKGETVSTIGKEKRSNPRLQVSNVDEYIEIMNNLDLKKPEKIDYNVASNLRLGI